MRIITYSAKKEHQQYFQKTLCPKLNQKNFDHWENFVQYIDSLSIPAQIFLDIDEHPVLSDNPKIINFLEKYSFHHIICLSEKIIFSRAIEFIGSGSLLTHWRELSHLNWWWNRSMIHFKKAEIQDMASKAIIVSPYSYNKNVHQFLERSLWRSLFEVQPLMIRFDGRTNFSRLHLELENFRDIVFKNKATPNYPIVAQFSHLSHLSPYGFKEFLKNFTDYFQQAPEIKLFLLSDQHQYALDRVLIPCFENEEFELYKMNFQNLEEKMKLDSQINDIHTQLLRKNLTFEHILLESGVCSS